MLISPPKAMFPATKEEKLAAGPRGMSEQSYDLTFDNIIHPALKFIEVLVRTKKDFAQTLLEEASLNKTLVERLFKVDSDKQWLVGQTLVKAYVSGPNRRLTSNFDPLNEFTEFELSSQFVKKCFERNFFE